MLRVMVRRVLWLCLVCGCTQDFDAFVPTDRRRRSGRPERHLARPGFGRGRLDSPTRAKDVTVKDVTPDIGPADVPPDVPVACTETGAITFNNHCYFLVATTATQAAAGTNCKNTGNAHLVTITTAGEQAAVIALGSGTERWTDLVHNGDTREGLELQLGHRREPQRLQRLVPRRAERHRPVRHVRWRPACGTIRTAPSRSHRSANANRSLSRVVLDDELLADRRLVELVANGRPLKVPVKFALSSSSHESIGRASRRRRSRRR